MANYKSKVNFLQQHLEDLLTQKKALHSRVVTEEFHKFKLTSSRVSFVSNVLLSILIVLISEYSLVNTVIISNSISINCPNFFPWSSSNQPFYLIFRLSAVTQQLPRSAKLLQDWKRLWKRKDYSKTSNRDLFILRKNFSQ